MYANRNVIWCQQCATNNVNQTQCWLKANNRELATSDRAILPEDEYAIYVNVVISIGICIWMQAGCNDSRALKTSALHRASQRKRERERGRRTFAFLLHCFLNRNLKILAMHSRVYERSRRCNAGHLFACVTTGWAGVQCEYPCPLIDPFTQTRHAFWMSSLQLHSFFYSFVLIVHRFRSRQHSVWITPIDALLTRNSK